MLKDFDAKILGFCTKSLQPKGTWICTTRVHFYSSVSLINDAVNSPNFVHNLQHFMKCS